MDPLFLTAPTPPNLLWRAQIHYSNAALPPAAGALDQVQGCEPDETLIVTGLQLSFVLNTAAVDWSDGIVRFYKSVAGGANGRYWTTRFTAQPWAGTATYEQSANVNVNWGAAGYVCDPALPLFVQVAVVPAATWVTWDLTFSVCGMRVKTASLGGVSGRLVRVNTPA